jgi:L-2-hydroxyglutarate oxidase LhgO
MKIKGAIQMYKKKEFDVVIVGGGFYGCSLALQMKNYFSNVLIIEKEEDLMLRASLINQARVHNGYHYPRNIITAYRSYINFPRFTEEFKGCIIDDFQNYMQLHETVQKLMLFNLAKCSRG